MNGIALVLGDTQTAPRGRLTTGVDLRLRARPSIDAPIVGVARAGTVLAVRSGRVSTDAADFFLVDLNGTLAFAAPDPADVPAGLARGSGNAERLRVSASPVGAAVALVPFASPVRVLAIAGGWARVRVDRSTDVALEGYLPASALYPVQTR